MWGDYAAEFYMVGPRDQMVWDDIGLKALARDWAAWPGMPSDDLMHRSQFNLFRDIGAHLHGGSLDALRFAMDKVAQPHTQVERPIDSQLNLALPRRGWRT